MLNLLDRSDYIAGNLDSEEISCLGYQTDLGVLSFFDYGREELMVYRGREAYRSYSSVGWVPVKVSTEGGLVLFCHKRQESMFSVFDMGRGVWLSEFRSEEEVLDLVRIQSHNLDFYYLTKSGCVYRKAQSSQSGILIRDLQRKFKFLMRIPDHSVLLIGESEITSLDLHSNETKRKNFGNFKILNFALIGDNLEIFGLNQNALEYRKFGISEFGEIFKGKVCDEEGQKMYISLPKLLKQPEDFDLKRDYVYVMNSAIKYKSLRPLSMSRKIGAVIHSQSENLFRMVLIDCENPERYSIVKIILSSQKFQSKNLEEDTPKLGELDFLVHEISRNNLNSIRFKGEIWSEKEYFSSAKRVLLSQYVGEYGFGDRQVDGSANAVEEFDVEGVEAESIHRIGAFQLSDIQRRAREETGVMSTSVQGGGDEYFLAKNGMERVGQMLRGEGEVYCKNLGLLGEYFLSVADWRRLRESQLFFGKRELAGLLLAQGDLRLIREGMGQYLTDDHYFTEAMELCMNFADSGIRILENGIKEILDRKEVFKRRETMMRGLAGLSQQMGLMWGYDVKGMRYAPQMCFDLNLGDGGKASSSKEFFANQTNMNSSSQELNLLDGISDEGQLIIPVKAMTQVQFLEKIIESVENLLMTAQERKETLSDWRMARANFVERLMTDVQELEKIARKLGEIRILGRKLRMVEFLLKSQGEFQVGQVGEMLGSYGVRKQVIRCLTQSEEFRVGLQGPKSNQAKGWVDVDNVRNKQMQEGHKINEGEKKSSPGLFSNSGQTGFGQSSFTQPATNLQNEPKNSLFNKTTEQVKPTGSKFGIFNQPKNEEKKSVFEGINQGLGSAGTNFLSQGQGGGSQIKWKSGGIFGNKNQKEGGLQPNKFNTGGVGTPTWALLGARNQSTPGVDSSLIRQEDKKGKEPGKIENNVLDNQKKPILQKLGIKISVLDHMGFGLQKNLNDQSDAGKLNSGSGSKAWRTEVRQQLQKNFANLENFLKNVLFRIKKRSDFDQLEKFILFSLKLRFGVQNTEGAFENGSGTKTQIPKIISGFLSKFKMSSGVESDVDFLWDLEQANDAVVLEILKISEAIEPSLGKLREYFYNWSGDAAANQQNRTKLEEFQKNCSTKLTPQQVRAILNNISRNKEISGNLWNSLRNVPERGLDPALFRHVLWTLSLARVPSQIQMFLQNQDASGSLLDPLKPKKNLLILKILFQIFSLQNEPLAAYQFLIKFLPSVNDLPEAEVLKEFFMEGSMLKGYGVRGLLVVALVLFFSYRGSAIGLFQLNLESGDEDVLTEFLGKGVAEGDHQSEKYDQEEPSKKLCVEYLLSRRRIEEAKDLLGKCNKLNPELSMIFKLLRYQEIQKPEINNEMILEENLENDDSMEEPLLSINDSSDNDELDGNSRFKSENYGSLLDANH